MMMDLSDISVTRFVDNSAGLFFLFVLFNFTNKY